MFCVDSYSDICLVNYPDEVLFITVGLPLRWNIPLKRLRSRTALLSVHLAKGRDIHSAIHAFRYHGIFDRLALELQRCSGLKTVFSSSKQNSDWPLSRAWRCGRLVILGVIAVAPNVYHSCLFLWAIFNLIVDDAESLTNHSEE